MKQLKLTLMLIPTIILLLLINGCTYESGPKTFEKVDNKPVSNPLAHSIIERAIAKTDKEGRKFWYNGWIVTKVQKRRTTSMYSSGTFDRDLGYLVKARVMGQDYRYYRYKKDVYVSEGDNWVKAPSEKSPLIPFSSFKSILPAALNAKQLPDEIILGRECYVFEIGITGSDARDISQEIAQAANRELGNLLVEQLEMKYRLWIGKKDSFIYQLKSESLIPVPEAGSMYQEVYFRFWDYNSPSITLTEPENVIKYLKK